MAHSPISIFFCPLCQTGMVGGEGTTHFVCGHCHYLFRPPAALFGEAEWLTESKPKWLALCLDALRLRPTARKTRLLCTAVAHIGFDCFKADQLSQSVDAAEEWADTAHPPNVRQLRENLHQPVTVPPKTGSDWQRIGFLFLSEDPTPDWDNFVNKPTQRMFADAYRELFANPFVPLTWNPDWFTSTVRDLATHIYTSREFGAMPILADALQDAGCEDEQILRHCRANRPHARGCWVLDAILGKT